MIDLFTAIDNVFKLIDTVIKLFSRRKQAAATAADVKMEKEAPAE